MNTAVAKVNTQAMITDPYQWSDREIQLLKDTVCKGATDDEFKIFCYAVKRTGLDPFMKQIHSVKRWNSKTNKDDMSIQVGIDGYRLIADRTKLYAGNDEAVFDNEKSPSKATVTVYKIVEGQRCPFTASARWAEYYPGDKQGFMWKKMPCVMLGKVAEALALRKAFPAELSGVHTDEEMEQANSRGVSVQPAQQNSFHSQSPIIEQKKPTIVINSKEPDLATQSSPVNEDPDSAAKKAESYKVKGLKMQLALTDDQLKEELFKEFKTESWVSLTLPQMKSFTAILEQHRENTNKSSHPSEQQSADSDSFNSFQGNL